MNLSNRELALIMLALDNTSATLGSSNKLQQQEESTDMDELWRRVREEREHREQAEQGLL